MSFFRIVAVFLAVAIGNPICCCVSFGATSFQDTKGLHACCLAAIEKSQEEQDQERPDPSVCPHVLEKDSRIIQVADSFDSLSKTHLIPVEWISISDVFALSAEAKLAVPKRDFGHSLSLSGSYSKAFCVFLL